MRMRFRTDGWHYADLMAHGWTKERYFTARTSDRILTEEEKQADEAEKKRWDETPKAEPGDVWRIRWYKEGGNGPVAGYAICCIGCGKVHHWTTALNCHQKYETSYTDKDGEHKYFTCPHSGTGSCWEWTGVVEEGTLNASPSLQVIATEPGDCAWHGYIHNGDIHT